MNQNIQPNFENVKNHMCVICENPTESGIYICLKCGKPCTPTYSQPIKKGEEGQFIILDIKSSCCNEDVRILSRITCSEECHNKFIEHMEQNFGKYKKVVDDETGIAHEVPTKDIIEHGLNQKDLHKYPFWNYKKSRKIPVK